MEGILIMKAPLIIAHRGSAGEAPENTLGSFKLALDQGCDAIELDIHLSADGEMMVIHDYTIDRTTTGAGRVRDMTVSELKQVDAGTKFHEKYTGERIPLLGEVFELVPGHIMINVEIKGGYHEGIADKLAKLLRSHNRVDGVVVSSFNHKVLVELKRIDSDVKIGLLYTADFVNHRKVAELVGEPVYSLHPHYSQISGSDISDAVSHGIQVYPYTINDEASMLHMIEAGASGIITDYPSRLKQLLASR
jgi:glycerophosphoryl diester phosphodiesterase